MFRVNLQKRHNLVFFSPQFALSDWFFKNVNTPSLQQDDPLENKVWQDSPRDLQNVYVVGECINLKLSSSGQSVKN